MGLDRHFGHGQGTGENDDQGHPLHRCGRGLLLRMVQYGLGLLLLFFLTACQTEHAPPPNPLREVVASMQGNNLYAQATLTPAFQREALELLKQGEPILAAYRFRLLEVRTLLPDREVSRLKLKRRLRYHLITQRYEMQEITRGQTYYTDDDDEALQFLGHPRNILLEERKTGATTHFLLPGRRYLLETHFELEREGISRPLRFLNRLFTFWRPVDYRLVTEFRHS
ncbi:MAG: DUF4390 domain-containing protein [Magnetococcus sp. DMHC-1]|nr:DUF4390 domain-containing protein [Magnetococcales bacterium]